MSQGPTRLCLETPQAAPHAATALPSQPIARGDADVAHWRTLATQNADRLRIAEEQAKALRLEADEARGRFTKYKQRLDAAQERVTALQLALTDVSAERDALRARVARQEILKRQIYEFRQSILDGPIWQLFSELCTDVSAAAGGEKDHA